MTNNTPTIEVKPLPPVGDMDAVKWAESFVAHVAAYPHTPTDQATMIGWFANAIMAGYDTAMRKHDAVEAERDTLKAAIEQLLDGLPETWGDKIRDGKIELLLDSEAIDAMFKAMQ